MTLAERLAGYLSELWGTPVEVIGLSRIPGGASRETYRFDAVADGGTRGLILRRDPAGSLIETERRLEYAAYQSFHGLGAPVPEPVALEESEGPLERPFFIMSRIDGAAAASPFTVEPYGVHAEALGRQFFDILGRIASTDVDALPLSAVTAKPAADAAWRTALDHWEAVIEADELHPQPIVRAALRWLRRHPPPPAQRLSVVHGDYRTGNFLHDGAGRIIAILDWEMAHIGDPLEDLGWALNPLWNHFDETRVGGMLPRAEALAAWSAASGLSVDPDALRWWELFNAVKGQGIWISAAKAYREGGGRDPVLGFSGWYTARRQDQIIADMLLALNGEASA